MPSDVTCVILATGERTTQEAIESLKKQTLLPREVIIVENVTPFYRALNEGASKVKTDFFVQVDSDMILYENALKTLRASMKKRTGVGVGAMTDPLLGTISGLKIFRTALFGKHKFKNTISPDTQFCDEIAKSGWRTAYIARGVNRFSVHGEVLGEHRPNYEPLYVFQKFKLEGARIRHRKDFCDFMKKWKIFKKDLSNSTHQSALIAMSHGIFSEDLQGDLKPFERDADFNLIDDLIGGTQASTSQEDNKPSLYFKSPRSVFEYFLHEGIRAVESNSFSRAREPLNWLSGKRNIFASLGLYQGLFLRESDSLEETFRIFDDLVGSSWFSFTIKRMREMCEGLKRYLTHFI